MYDEMKSKNEALRLELEEKCKKLNECLNQNATLKVSMNEKEKHVNHMHRYKNSRKKHAHTTCYECGRIGHIAFYYSFKNKRSHLKKIWVPKGSHVLTNNQ